MKLSRGVAISHCKHKSNKFSKDKRDQEFMCK